MRTIRTVIEYIYCVFAVVQPELVVVQPEFVVFFLRMDGALGNFNAFF